MNALVSGLYFGVVTHRRFGPRTHALRYRLFQGLFDLDELPALGRRLRFFSYNRPGIFSFHDRDHGNGAPGPLRGYVEELLGRAGIELPGGAIQILCMPRLLGHVFNPLSIYFCRDSDGTLAALIYEVNNTFGERHSYLIPVARHGGAIVRQTCGKAFHVSPFMDMAMTYDFTVAGPGERLSTVVEGRDLQGAPLIAAAFAGDRRDFTDRSLLTAMLRYPLLTLKVVAAIHFEAVRLMVKGLRLRPHPEAPAHAVTVVSP